MELIIFDPQSYKWPMAFVHFWDLSQYFCYRVLQINLNLSQSIALKRVLWPSFAIKAFVDLLSANIIVKLF